MTRFPCPYVFPDGRRCPGHIVKIEAFHADLSWLLVKAMLGHSVTRSRAHSTTCSAPKRAIMLGIVAQNR
jgi:hypothetical protein